ncbi:MAG: hypothetical protein AUH71_05725 [Thaumarchaeota archaeon 13_1_40CM_4_48_7]|nr:MAG: hypothetical protein AUH71_05725 [Thaumarchaeota archaeon 13_1_40CM_4_48_7]
MFYGRAVETACKSSIIHLAWWIIKRWAVVVSRQVLSTSRRYSLSLFALEVFVSSGMLAAEMGKQVQPLDRTLNTQDRSIKEHFL